jgi:hypothetical protein
VRKREQEIRSMRGLRGDNGRRCEMERGEGERLRTNGGEERRKERRREEREGMRGGGGGRI